MLTHALTFCYVLLTLSMGFSLVRLVRGPGTPDRALALDTIYVVGMATLLLRGISQKTTLYYESALLIAALSFVSTVAVAKYMLRGDIIES